MANLCEYYAQVIGKAKDVAAFLEWLKENSYWSFVCCDKESESYAPDDIISVRVDGDCRWSVHSSMMFEGCEKSIESVSKTLGVVVEIYSSEPGVGFQEHYLIEKGDVTIAECEDYEEIYVGDFESLEEFNKEHNTAFTEDMVKDDYIHFGGFGDNFCDFYTIENYLPEFFTQTQEEIL